jgi:hypothetical protein
LAGRAGHEDYLSDADCLPQVPPKEGVRARRLAALKGAAPRQLPAVLRSPITLPEGQKIPMVTKTIKVDGHLGNIG